MEKKRGRVCFGVFFCGLSIRAFQRHGRGREGSWGEIDDEVDGVVVFVFVLFCG